MDDRLPRDLVEALQPPARARQTSRGVEVLDDNGVWQAIAQPPTVIADQVVRSRRTRGRIPQTTRFAFVFNRYELIGAYILVDGEVVLVESADPTQDVIAGYLYTVYFWLYTDRSPDPILIDSVDNVSDVRGATGIGKRGVRLYATFDRSGQIFIDLKIFTYTQPYDTFDRHYTVENRFYKLVGREVVPLPQSGSYRAPLAESQLTSPSEELAFVSTLESPLKEYIASPYFNLSTSFAQVTYLEYPGVSIPWQAISPYDVFVFAPLQTKLVSAQPLPIVSIPGIPIQPVRILRKYLINIPKLNLPELVSTINPLVDSIQYLSLV